MSAHGCTPCISCNNRCFMCDSHTAKCPISVQCVAGSAQTIILPTNMAPGSVFVITGGAGGNGGGNWDAGGAWNTIPNDFFVGSTKITSCGRTVLELGSDGSLLWDGRKIEADEDLVKCLRDVLRGFWDEKQITSVLDS